MLTPSNLSNLTQMQLNQSIIRSPLVVSPKATVMDAITLMSGIRNTCETKLSEDHQLVQLHLEAKSSCVFVINNGQIKGIFTEKDVTRLSAEERPLSKLLIEEVMISSVVTLSESDFTDLFSAVNLLQKYKIRHLPIVDECNHLVGLVTNETLGYLFRPVDLLRLRRVEEVMTREVLTTHPETNILGVVKQMAEFKVSSIVITDENNTATGIITERDLVQFSALGISMENCQAREVMSTPVFTISPEESLLKVQTLMEKHLIRRLIIIGEKTEILGIVTQTDVLKTFNPLEMFNLATILEQKVAQLESEKIALLENRNHELEEKIAFRTNKLQNKRKREKLIAQITNRIRSSLDLEEILNTCVNELRAFSGCDRVLVFEFQPDWSGIITAESVAEKFPVTLGNVIRDSYYQSEVIKIYPNKDPIVVNNIYSSNYQDCHIKLLEQYQIKSNLVAPIYVQEELWGLLVGNQCQDYRHWQPEDVNLFKEISAQLAIAVQQSLNHQQLQVELRERQKAELLIQEQLQELTQWRNRHEIAKKANRQVLFEYDFTNDRLIFDDNVTDILGYPSPDFVTNMQEWIKLIHLEDQSLFQEYVYESLSHQTSFQEEYRFLHQQGNYIWLEDCNKIFYDDQGKPIKAVGLLTDITNRKLAEIELQKLNQELENKVLQRTEELRKINRLQKAILNSTNYSIISINNKGIIQTFNQGAEEMFLYTAEEVIGKATPELFIDLQTIQDLAVSFSPELSRKIRSDLELLTIKSTLGIVNDFKAISIRKDGSRFWTHISVSPLKNESNEEIIGFVGIAKDITAQEQAEQERQELLQELSTFKWALDQSAIVAITDTKGVINYANNYFCQISGYSREELIGQTHRIVNSGHHPKEFFQNMWATISKGTIWSGEICNRAKNGNLYWVESHIVPFLNKEGKIEKYLAIRFNSTRRKFAEAQIIQENNFRRQILDSMTDGLCVCQLIEEYPFINFTVWNPKMEEITGYSQAEINELGWYQSIDPDPQIQYQAMKRMESMRQGDDLHNEEWQIQTKIGESKIIRISTSMFLDNNKSFVLAIIQDITIQKQQEIEKNTLKAQLEFVLAKSPAVIYALKAQDFSPIFISKNIQKILGYSPEEFVNQRYRKLLNLIHPEDTHQMLPEIYQLSRREIYKTEYRILHQNGNYIWVQTGMKLSRDEYNKHSQIVGYIIDITEQKQAQIDLQTKTEELDRFFSIALDLLCIANTDGYFVHLNPQWEKVLGYPLDELEGSKFLNYVHPEDLDSTLQAISILKDQIEIPTFSNRYRCKDGSYRWIEWRSVPVGQYIYAAASDVTESKENEEAINRQLAAIEAAVNGIAIVQDDKYIYVNQSYHNIFGYQQGELIGKNWRELYATQDLQYIEQEVFPLVMKNKAWTGEIKAKRKDGSIFNEGLSLTITDEGLIICVCEDITERKQQEIELQETNAELARATRLKDEFLANMSHELRTPLNAILGMAEGLSEGVFGEVNDRQLQSVKTIEQSGTHLLGLINDILDVAKIESGKFELDLLPTEISSLCSSSLAFIKQQAFKKSIQLETTLAKGLPSVLVDENRIRQVLINLLTNAVKFTPEGGKITLEISFNQNYTDYSSFAPIHWIEYKAELTPDLKLSPEYLSPPSYLLISIMDTGIGIDEKHITKLFQPFIQIDSALNRQYAGTGLGLVLVQRIIQLHGGQIGLSSIKGQGTNFIIALPCLKSPLSNFRTISVESNQLSININPDRVPLLLLAEDNPANVSTISSYLKAKGYQLIMAQNGREAIALAETEKPDLIMMDIQMPEVNGLDAIQQIRLNPDLADIPIIALTALAMAKDEKLCLEAGANKYMTKPVKLKQLLQAISECLTK